MRHFDCSEALLRVLSAPRRNHFFYGKRMDVQHFDMEQDYGKLKQWLLNRLALGKGVLCGLRVSIDGDRVCVDPGVAIDGLGREIIVPVRACIDPLAVDDGCCGEHRVAVIATTPLPPPSAAVSDAGTQPASPGPAVVDAAVAPPPPTRATNGIFTLWVCYRECLADHEPILVSECSTRDHCAAGTVVETFCLKATPGLPPLQGDPIWCAKLWGDPTLSGDDSDFMTSLTLDATHGANVMGVSADDVTAIKEAMQSHRHLLCELFDGTCDPPEGDPCVPLALIVLRDGKMNVESCVVRPRIYSNTRLLDLILCLAAKIDECCGKHGTTTDPMRVSSVDFLVRNTGGAESVVATMKSPLANTAIVKPVNSIRIRFSKPFAQDATHKPTTHGLNDPDFNVHNVQVLLNSPVGGVGYVPGSLAIEAPNTIRFDVVAGSPVVDSQGRWPRGTTKCHLRLRGAAAGPGPALADTSGAALDGEPIAPANGVISGDGTPGGDFSASFSVKRV